MIINVTMLACSILLQGVDESTEPSSSSSYDTTLDFHYYHQFDASITSGGDVKVSSSGAELRISSPVSDNDDLLFRFQYQKDDWDFGGTTGLGGNNPWSTINTLDIALQWTHQYDQKSRWFVGGIARASYEDSASMNSKAGGSAGIIHSFSKDLTLGIGAGVIGQVHDDPKVFPIFVVEWNINDTLRLSSDISTRFGSRTGLELIWTPRKDWSYGLGYSYSYSRFRLDETGFAPNGAGEATSWPLTLRATYKASPTFSITFLGGIVFDGHLEVTNSSRRLINSTDYEHAGAIGILGNIRF